MHGRGHGPHGGGGDDGGSFGVRRPLRTAKLDDAASSRVRSSELLKTAVVKALGCIHALLDPEQRKQFAFLIRTGAVQF